MKSILIAAALAASVSVAHADHLQGNYFVEEADKAVVAGSICNYAGETRYIAATELAEETTGHSFAAVNYAVRMRVRKIVDHLVFNRKEAEFCRNVYNGNW